MSEIKDPVATRRWQRRLEDTAAGREIAFTCEDGHLDEARGRVRLVDREQIRLDDACSLGFRRLNAVDSVPQSGTCAAARLYRFLTLPLNLRFE